MEWSDVGQGGPVALGWLYPTIRLFHGNISAKVPP